jgi:hypothetical protein
LPRDVAFGRALTGLEVEGDRQRLLRPLAQSLLLVRVLARDLGSHPRNLLRSFDDATGRLMRFAADPNQGARVGANVSNRVGALAASHHDEHRVVATDEPDLDLVRLAGHAAGRRD